MTINDAETMSVAYIDKKGKTLETVTVPNRH